MTHDWCNNALRLHCADQTVEQIEADELAQMAAVFLHSTNRCSRLKRGLAFICCLWVELLVSEC